MTLSSDERALGHRGMGSDKMRQVYFAIAGLLLSLPAHSVEPYWEEQSGVTIADLWGPDTQLLESAGLSWAHDGRAVILYLRVGDDLWRCPDFSNRDMQHSRYICSRLRVTDR